MTLEVNRVCVRDTHCPESLCAEVDANDLPCVVATSLLAGIIEIYFPMRRYLQSLGGKCQERSSSTFQGRVSPY